MYALIKSPVRVGSRNFLTICLTRVLTLAPSRYAWQLFLYLAHFGALILGVPIRLYTVEHGPERHAVVKSAR